MDADGRGDIPTAMREYIREWNRARGLPAQHPEWGEADWNRWDYRATKHLLEKGYDEDTTREAISRCSPNVSSRHRDVWEYAVRTIEAAFSAIAREREQEFCPFFDR